MSTELEKYALEITKVLTGLAGGGSELFEGQMGEMFKADLVLCASRIRDRHARVHKLLIDEKREAKNQQDRIAEQDAKIAQMREALEEISQSHDGNPPMALADMPELDYARRTISNMRHRARVGLKDDPTP